ncbi:DUF3408 domain-containing protein (plasmid) [Hymenobacter sp. NBH84]|uniref:DUF3408 domain-containing protein n=1 Tax=Hymenobacter sp. NBH84 TaxID=2596915 RepID=UPI0016248F58|nr:DUF3408 domain-containing protein [Hymenobacter sp. NBH84]QNE42175.1 DUF3408 domain-containing protein [Hymenobacter sp. NBH84]
MATKETPNLRNVMAFVANRPAAPVEEKPAAPAPAPEPTPEPEASVAPAPVAPPPAPPAESSKQKQKKQRAAVEQQTPEQDTYADTFLVPIRSRKPKTIYVDEDTHEALSVITRAADGVGLSDLIINIVNHHFETYGKDIRSFLDSIENQKKKRLPY